MRSRAARVFSGLATLIALAAAAVFLLQSERQIAARRDGVRAFDLGALEAADLLAEVRASQQAYVAAGQGVQFWMPKVAELAARVEQQITALESTAPDRDARGQLDGAASAMTAFADADKRVREYLEGGQELMAADVIFTEGGESTTKAARSIEAARLAAHQANDAAEARFRRDEAMALGAAAAFAAVMVLLLALTGRSSASDALVSEPESASATPLHRLAPARPAVPTILRETAQLCTDFGSVHEVSDIRLLLSRATDLLDASGLIVWLGSTTGSDLQPILAHGYTDEAFARLPAVPRAANNAAALAYRTGRVQIVRSRPGGQSGAIVAPILSSRGCVGALSAEIRGGGEASETVEALAAIVAAQLASLVAPPEEDTEKTRAAL